MERACHAFKVTPKTYTLHTFTQLGKQQLKIPGYKILATVNESPSRQMLQTLSTVDEYGSSHVSYHVIQTQTRHP
jgi:hypothetical protein